MSGRPVLRLELRASRALAVALALVHGGGAACVIAVAPGIPALALSVLLLALGAAAAWDRALLRRRSSVRALELAAEGAATLELADGRRLSVRVAGRRQVTLFWVTLPLSGAWSRTLLIAADMLAPADFRRLRLWALWGRVAGTAWTPNEARGGGA